MRQGFSFIELSVVLVVIGLLAGAITVGRSLIDVANMDTVINEAQRFTAASETFRDKYSALPGDMPNATKYWGMAAPGTACFDTIGSGTATCNGDGDGKISMCSPLPCNAGTRISGEMFRYWQQLADAKLITGSFSGVSGFAAGSMRDSVPGVNVPASRFTGGGWSIEYLGQWAGDSNSFAGNYGNSYSFGGYTGDKTFAPLLSPLEAATIDQKVDDGQPGTGKVLSTWTYCTTASGPNDLTATYKRNDSTPNKCNLGFVRVI